MSSMLSSTKPSSWKSSSLTSSTSLSSSSGFWSTGVSSLPVWLYKYSIPSNSPREITNRKKERIINISSETLNVTLINVV